MSIRAIVSGSLLFFSITASAGVTAPQKGWKATLDGKNGSVEFIAIGHPSALKVHGKGAAPQGILNISGQKVSGTLAFDLNSLDTGISLRNEHMKNKYLDTPKYAQATLTLTRLELPEAFSDSQASFKGIPFEGQLALHGTQKPVSGTLDVANDGRDLSFNARFALKISEFGIPAPGYAGITLADEVNVTAQGHSLIEK